MRTRPLGNVPEKEGSVWNLSDADYSEEEHADYAIYGDSLFSETVDGIRRWYSLARDTVCFIREESMRHSFEPCGPIMSAATGMAATASRTDTVRGEGFSYNTMRLMREGVYSSHGPVSGRLVVPSGDTIPAHLTVENFRYTEKNGTDDDVFPLDAVTDSLLTYTTTHYRWFGVGPLPVAVQTEIRTADFEGHPVSESSAAYTLDFGSIDPDEETDNPENIEEHLAAAFGAATVTVDGSDIRVTLDVPFPTDITLEVVSDSGIPYIHHEFRADGPTQTHVSASGLPPGRHVAALSAMSVMEKWLITVD